MIKHTCDYRITKHGVLIPSMVENASVKDRDGHLCASKETALALVPLKRSTLSNKALWVKAYHFPSTCPPSSSYLRHWAFFPSSLSMGSHSVNRWAVACLARGSQEVSLSMCSMA